MKNKMKKESLSLVLGSGGARGLTHYTNQYKNQEYSSAAKAFDDALYKAASLYRAGEFKKSQAIYATMSSPPVAKYNLGKGEYEEAIKAYDIALQMQPDFKEAKSNKALAIARKELKDVENDGQQGVGALGADEIVYDNSENKGEEQTQEESTQTKQQNNTNWLDRIQTSPKDFLKHKFAYQYGMGRENPN
jgi:Ca-activated chloride channel family protein